MKSMGGAKLTMANPTPTNKRLPSITPAESNQLRPDMSTLTVAK